MSAINIDSYDFKHLKECTLGERLRFFRQHMVQYHGSDYTITSLGSRIGVAPQSISAIERGDSKNPSFQLIHKLTQEYRVPLESVTDEFYLGEERLFSIGIPEVIETDIDFDDVDELVIAVEDNESNDDEIYFDFDDTKGILLYHCLGKNEYKPIYHIHFKEDITDYEMESLISRMLMETTSLTQGNFDSSKANHPLHEARQIINSQNKLLSSGELINLLVNKKK
ncbi:helix-turn-helix domain-containing protein [Paucisalibacillus globulus]|uniref:helix-turn-helix domain-containing protein n=1 Tax=Paucisalibacillus globulus TaxID=351095 RepID=UPI0003FF2295|nr:helix-turn-helix transcriptional regulator [Paucisalibacillus globulus]